MADNMSVTEGSGKTIAADDIGSVLYQRVKLGVGADGTATDLAFGQATMANSLPTVLASDQSKDVYLSGTCLTMTGTSLAATIPSGATWAVIRAEGDEVYWELNSSGSASTTSPGYVAADNTAYIPPISNFGTMLLYGGTAAKAHIEFFQSY